MTDLRERLAAIVEIGMEDVQDFDTTFRQNAADAAAQAIIDALPGLVKPLEWEWRADYGLISRATTPLGTYSIHADEDSAFGRLLCFLHLTGDADCTRYAIELCVGYVEPEEAQAAAQADYTRRILAAFGIAEESN